MKLKEVCALRRIICVLSAVLLCMSALSLAGSASGEGVKANPPVTVPFAEPVIDGSISKNEGWSAAADFSDDTCGYFWAFNPLSTYGSLYFAYSDEGLFFAADLTERDYLEHNDQNGDMRVYEGNGFVPCTGEDNVNVQTDGSRDYGWNGDVLTLMIDPCGKLAGAGLDGNQDYSAWYDIGFFVNGKVRIYRGKVSPGEITSVCRSKAKKTAGGWCVEVFIPWSEIIRDTAAVLDGRAEIAEDEVTKGGAVSRAAVMYMDRFLDPDSDLVDTWGRFITVADLTTNGTPGHMSSGDHIGGYGLVLENGERPAQESSSVSTAAESSEPVQAENESGTSSASERPEVAAQEQTTKNAATQDVKGTHVSAQTYDAGIAAFAGALIVSAIGAVYGKKRK